MYHGLLVSTTASAQWVERTPTIHAFIYFASPMLVNLKIHVIPKFLFLARAASDPYSSMSLGNGRIIPSTCFSFPHIHPPPQTMLLCGIEGQACPGNPS